MTLTMIEVDESNFGGQHKGKRGRVNFSNFEAD